MPSRKKDRGKQRKAAKENGVKFYPHLGPEIKEFMAEGCRVVLRDNGRSSSILHPCLSHIEGGKSSATARTVRDFDRGLLNDGERLVLAENYFHNFGQALREGNYFVTDIIRRNIADPHIGQQLENELLAADIHLSLLHFLNQSAKSSSDALGRVVGARESTMLAYNWVLILGLLIQDGLVVDARDGVRSKVAKGMKPFVMAMMDDKRELFQSNHVWHLCLSSFFIFVHGIMKSKEAFLAMASYEGFLPFVAQASCWSQSRVDIASESESLRRLYPDPSTSPDPLSLSARKAQRILSLAIAHYGVVQGEDVMRGALDQIACTPLLSNNPECKDSTMAGLVRMMSNDKSIDRSFLFESIVRPLLLEYGYVDAGVITELIEFGKNNSSAEAANIVLNLMVAILGRDNNYAHIKRIDSRYAAAVRYGLLEFCIDALLTYGSESDCEIGEDLHFIAGGMYDIAMHSRTSRVLRERKDGIVTALDALRKKSVVLSDKICSFIDDAVKASSCATCCNCLKEVDRKELLFCKRCGVECYCSIACQSESYGLGHEGPCKEIAVAYSTLREKGFSETELKRMAVLSCNLMMNGCGYVRSKAAEFLDEESNVAEVTICFRKYPPGIEVSRSETGESSGRPDGLKITFTAPVYYGFAEKVDVEMHVLEKVISRRSLVQETLRIAQLDKTQQRITKYFQRRSHNNSASRVLGIPDSNETC